MDETQAGEIGQIDQIAGALSQFQGEVPTVAKTKTAQIRSDKGNYSYSYADLADVTEAAMPILAKYGLAFITIPGNGVLTGMLLHTSGQSMTGSLPISGGTPQQIGSSLTYMRRYLLGCMTGLVTDNDDDGQIAQASSSRAAAAAPAATRTMSRKSRATPQTGGGGDAPEGPLVRTGSDPAGDTPPPSERPIDPNGPQMKALHAALTEAGFQNRDQYLPWLSAGLGRDIASSKDITVGEASRALDALRDMGRADVDPTHLDEEPM